MADDDTPKGRAARKFGEMFAAEVFKDRKGHGGGPASYVTITQADLANMTAAAFEVGAQWRADATANVAWQPIETAPRDREVIFWLRPKTAEETYQDTSGKPIVVSAIAGGPYAKRTKFKCWGSLWTATHWMEPWEPSAPSSTAAGVGVIPKPARCPAMPPVQPPRSSDPQSPPIGPGCCGGEPNCDTRAECQSSSTAHGVPSGCIASDDNVTGAKP